MIDRHSAIASPPDVVSRGSVTSTAPEAGKSTRVFKRNAGRGNRAVGGRLAAVLAARHGLRASAGEYVIKENGTRSWFDGPDWRMRISDEGNNVRFRRDREASVTRLSLAQKPSETKIVLDGLSEVKNTLAGFVRLNAGEELVSLGIQYEYASEQAANAPAPTAPQVAGWTAIFGRAVDGRLVVGGGSHVAVMFDAKGRLEALDVDWPDYVDSGRVARIADSETIRARAIARDTPMTGNERRQERDLDCGYFDPGGRRSLGGITYLQPACVRRVVTFATDLAPGNEEKTAVSQVIPASENPIDDPSWADVVNFCKSGKGCEPIE